MRAYLRLLGGLLAATIIANMPRSHALPSGYPPAPTPLHTNQTLAPAHASLSLAWLPVARHAPSTEPQNVAARVTWEASYVYHSVNKGYDPSYGGDFTDTVHEELVWRGDAIVHTLNNTQYALPFAMTVSFERDQSYIQNQDCNRPIVEHGHQSLTAPPDDIGRPEFNLRIQVSQRDDGSYYIADPFPFFLDQIQFGTQKYLFGYLRTHHHVGARCWADPTDITETESSRDIFPVRPFPPPGDIEGDPRGMTFYKETDVPLPHDPATLIHWKVSIQRLGDCPAGSGPIDGTNPALNDVDVTLGAPAAISPEGSATLIARVMCNGRPVRNASLEVSSEALPYSGGHRHDDPAHPRRAAD